MRSDNVTKGVDRAPNRSLFAALGLTPEEQARPLVGIVWHIFRTGRLHSGQQRVLRIMFRR